MPIKDGQFKPGQPKTGGRKKGSTNLMPKKIREFLLRHTFEYMTTTEGLRNFKSDFQMLRPADRIAINEKYMKYILPTMASMKLEGDGDSNTPLKIKVVWEDALPADSKADEDGSDRDYSEDV